jgi:hypothetical protein
VYDKYGENILSPLLSVSELRGLGVTLYLQLDAEREHIPGEGKAKEPVLNSWVQPGHPSEISPVVVER